MELPNTLDKSFLFHLDAIVISAARFIDIAAEPSPRRSKFQNLYVYAYLFHKQFDARV